MGNWLFGGNSNNANNGNIEQPKIFGSLPKPYPITKINPALLVYPSKGKGFVATVDANSTPAEAVEYLLSKGCLANGSRRLVVITHGFKSNKDTRWLHQLKDLILRSDPEQDLAILGWGSGAELTILEYGQAASNCLETGRWLGEIMTEIKARCPNLEIYGIGHSLGSHLMGMAGRSSKVFSRITGLDPAGVGFQNTNIDKRLNSLDATMVDVIHTDGQDVPYFGTLVPMGTIDFYPNYGWNQPTMDRNLGAKPDIERDEKTKAKLDASEYGGYISKSHGRAIDFFLWSVNHKGAFRTFFHLDGVPDVERPVHRIYAKPEKDGVEVEMGYHCDNHIKEQLQLVKCKQQITVFEEKNSIDSNNETHAKMVEERVDDTNDKFNGNYYVHTNGEAPWC